MTDPAYPRQVAQLSPHSGHLRAPWWGPNRGWIPVRTQWRRPAGGQRSRVAQLRRVPVALACEPGYDSTREPTSVADRRAGHMTHPLRRGISDLAEGWGDDWS